MAFLRLLAIVAALAAVLCAGAFLFTRERKYLRWAWRVLQITAALALIFFGVLFAEEIWFRPKS
jgi:threonine/homoserine/homoserine lactone efflux protein